MSTYIFHFKFKVAIPLHKTRSLPTFAATEAPGHVNTQVMFVTLDWLEVVAAENVVATQMHAPCCYAEITHMVCCWATDAPVEAACKTETCTARSFTMGSVSIPKLKR